MRNSNESFSDAKRLKKNQTTFTVMTIVCTIAECRLLWNSSRGFVCVARSQQLTIGALQTGSHPSLPHRQPLPPSVWREPPPALQGNLVVKSSKFTTEIHNMIIIVKPLSIQLHKQCDIFSAISSEIQYWHMQQQRASFSHCVWPWRRRVHQFAVWKKCKK